MEVIQESPLLIHLSANQRLLALNNANIIYQNVGSTDLMTSKEYRLYQEFLDSPVVRNSDQLRESVEFILQMFLDLVDIDQENQ